VLLGTLITNNAFGALFRRQKATPRLRPLERRQGC
jgi:hypothetical protein